MALPRLESFTHADASDLVAAISGWAYLAHASANLLGIASNQVYGNAGGLDSFAYDTLNSYNNDQYAQIVAHNSSAGYIGVAVRCDTADPNGSTNTHRTCYYFECTSGDRYFAKKIAGVETALGEDAGTLSDGDLLRIEASGTTITVKVNGSTLFSVTDSSIAAGSAGIAAFDNHTGSIGDNWEGGNLGAAPSFVPHQTYMAGILTQ